MYAVVVALVVVLEIVFAIAAHPWVLFPIAAVGGGIGYWWWWFRPQRRARLLREQEERDRQELRERSQTLGGLLALTPDEFELRVGDILAGQGFTGIEHVGKAGDHGIDLFAISPEGERVGVQCKRNARERLVGGPVVRLLFADMTHFGVGGMVVTTSGFTTQAATFAASHDIGLVDGARLAQLAAATTDSDI